MGGRAPGEVSTARAMTECCLPRHRHAGPGADTEEAAQSGPPPQKGGPCQACRKETGEDAGGLG